MKNLIDTTVCVLTMFAVIALALLGTGGCEKREQASQQPDMQIATSQPASEKQPAATDADSIVLKNADRPQPRQPRDPSNAANEESLYSFWRQCEDSQLGFLGFEPKSAEVIAICKDGHIEGYAANLGMLMLTSDFTVSDAVLSFPEYRRRLAFTVRGDILTMKTAEGKTMKYQRLSGSARDEFVRRCKPRSIPEEGSAKTDTPTTSQQPGKQSATSQPASEKQPAATDADSIVPEKDEPTPRPRQDQKTPGK